jgi:predicted RNA-binding Zn ribbon-like protein
VARLIDGVRVPDQVAGHPGLELCNTRAGWPGPVAHEYLISPRALAVWAFGAGLLPAGTPVGDGDDERAALHAAIELRGQVYRCVLALAGPADGAEPATRPQPADTRDWHDLAEAVRRARAVANLGPDPDGARARWSLPADLRLPAAWLAVHAATLAADEFLTGPLAGTACACPGPGCGWLFADPRRRRRWCTMTVCGNRAKARRHAKRRRAPVAPSS